MEDPETMETEPAWLPRTYNLQTELPLFVSYFQNRKEKWVKVPLKDWLILVVFVFRFV